MHKHRISKETVRNVAQLAGLRLDDHEVERYRAELEGILDSFQILDEIDTEGIESVWQPVDLEGGLRADEVRPCPRCSTLHLEEGFFRVPRENE